MTTKAVRLGDDPRWHLVESESFDHTVCGERTLKDLSGMGGEDMGDCMECLRLGGFRMPESLVPPLLADWERAKLREEWETVTITMNDVTNPFQVPEERVIERVRLLKMRDEWLHSTLSGFCAQQGRTAGQIGLIIGILIALAVAMMGVAFLISWISEVPA